MGAIDIACDLLSNYLSSKDEGTNAPNLSSYTSACEEDPELKSFGSSLDQRFNKLKSSLAPGGITENIPLLSVKTICWFLVEVSQVLSENIIANKDILENEELRSLVDLYYESSTKTLDLFNTVGASTKKAKLSIVIIRIAIKQFEKESMETDLDHGDNKKKYEDTLKELNKVKAMGDPFGEEYKKQLESVRAEQLMVLEKFQELVKKLDAKKEELKNRRRLATIVYVSAAFCFLAAEIIVCMLAPPLLLAIAAPVATGGNFVVGTVGVLVHEMLMHRDKDLDRQKEVVDIMVDNTKVNIQGTNTINSLVEKLIASLSLILGTAELAVVKREEEAVKPVMEAILREVETLATTIQEVGEAVATCSTCVTKGKVKVLEHITNSVSSKGK